MAEPVKHTVDIVSGVVAVSTLAQWLPPVAALLTIIWTTLRIIEMVTGKTIPQLLNRKGTS